MKLALFLSTDRENGITPTMAQNYFKKINWTTNYDSVKEILEEMVKLKWVVSKILPYRSNMTVYTLTEHGDKVVTTTHELLQASNPLMSLRAFNNLLTDAENGS